MSFIQKCERALTTKPVENNFNGFVLLLYVHGVSRKIGRILKQQKVKVAYKPQQTINSLFPRPKELDDSDRQKSGIVYKISCTQCNFVYYGQTERSLKTRIVGYKKAVASFDQNSKVAGHVHLFGHSMNLLKCWGRWFRIQLPWATFSRSLLALYVGPERWERSHPTKKVSREHELHGHADKLCVMLLSVTYDSEFRFHITDEGLSISRSVCCKLSRVSGKPFP